MCKKKYNRISILCNILNSVTCNLSSSPSSSSSSLPTTTTITSITICNVIIFWYQQPYCVDTKNQGLFLFSCFSFYYFFYLFAETTSGYDVRAKQTILVLNSNNCKLKDEKRRRTTNNNNNNNNLSIADET